MKGDHTAETIYFYTHDGRLVREVVDDVIQRDYLYAGNDRIAVAERESDLSPDYHLHYFIKDHLGSTRATVDSTGLVTSQYDYHPYGGLRRSYISLDTDVRFTGKHLDDESGVSQYYFGRRYLHNRTFRFNSIDPKASSYPGWSPYVYALDNPVRLYDPSGEDVWDFMKGVWTGEGRAIRDAVVGIVQMQEMADPLSPSGSWMRMQMAEGFSQIASDPIGFVGSIMNSYADQWSSGDFGKGMVVGEGIIAAADMFAGTKGAGKLSSISKAVDATNLSRFSGVVDASKSWSTVRGQVWKAIARSEAESYTPKQLARMKNGCGPRQMNPRTGKIETKELHHIKPRREGGTHDPENLLDLWPEEHSTVDKHRHIK